MSELLQSGQHPRHSGLHPDVDQLSAFVDHALPAHERADVLAHLAVCPDCRETVALSLPPAESLPMPAGAPARKPWFSGWTVFLPAAAALAGLALFVLYIDRAPTGRHSEVVQMAVSTAPAPAPPAVQPIAPVSAAPALKSLPPSRELSSNRLAAAEQPGAAIRTGAPSGASAIVEREQIQSFGALSQAPQSPPGRIPVENKKSTAGVAGGLGAGAAASYAEASPPPPAAFAESQPQNAAKTAPGPANSGVPQFAPAAAPPAVSAPPAAAQSVAVVNAGPSIETTSADVLDSVLVSNQLHGALVPHALPSRLSVLSIANYGGKVLAIDARNAVFLSADSGRHWKPVRAAWQGRAIKADLVSPSVGFGAGAMSSRGNMVSFAGRDRSLAPAGNASLTGTVTDRSGAVIPGATVVVTDPATKIAQTVKTDADGRYVAGGLAGGAYNLEAQAPGFAALRLGGVRVDALQPNVANLTLNVGAVSQTVTVEAAPQASRSVSAARLSAVAPPAALPALPVFEITTDAGDRWTSADGETWKHD